MAKGVKKIKESETSNVLENHTSRDNNIICIKPNKMVNFNVSEWYEDTTPEDKQRNITWLWQNQKKTEVIKTTVKRANTPFGVSIPKKLCGSYAYYLEASLYGRHDPGKTGLHVYGKCDKKITSSSWSKTKGVADNSEISYGHNLFITLNTEGVNGDILSIELYSEKNPQCIQTKNEKCIDGKIVDVKFSTFGYNFFISGVNTLLSGQNSESEKFYIKVKDITDEYLTNASGSDRILFFFIANKVVQPIIEVPTNTAPLTIDTTPVEEIVRTEGIISAYFAKEEFSLETSEAVGKHEYIFKTKNVPIDKDKAAKIIKQRVDAQVKADKKYSKLDDIKNALTENNYDIGDPVSFDLYKLGANYIKINNAPLEEEVYVVAKTFLLDGKEVSITIKEKETIIVDADTAVPVLEAKEDGAELTTLKATVENGIAKVNVKLRPKDDEDLKTWKEKLLKGKKEEAYTYTFKNDTAITVDNKKQFAAIILKNAKEGKQGNTKIAAGKTAFVDDVEKALENKTYKGGDPITFDTYKTQTESLWLKAECLGDTVKHEGEFLKRDGEYFTIKKAHEIIFPLLVKSENDTGNKWGKGFYWAANQAANQATFNSNRGGGTRKHAGRDLYTNPEEPVVAICKGEVLEVKSFYAQTNQVTILHETNDGRKFIIRYGELAPNSITVKKGDSVIQKQQIGVTGHLVGITVITGETIYMLHFEHYTGDKGYDLSIPLSTDDKPFMRRIDLVDSVTILQEGFRNTFGENAVQQLFTINHAKEALIELYNKYKNQSWNWKWEGSEKEIVVSGKDILIIVEKMYRLETFHFTSEQYEYCGTGGMESFGSAPYYGWDSSLFTKQPLGIWSAFEGKGLSGKGGNEQVTTKQKEFVKLPSVIVGMEYKIKYIIKYEGNYARWYNTNADKQEKYIESLKGVKAKIIESL
ncbi:M23 family metallopeptidase [Flavobacterium fluviatile]|uniref:M23 family metallopeptidase n=1 Tax=Flavobacterium fluviatile TaxID=1862387 RepID=UPI0013D33097|nr:M23 family metallopeptidase [Flavobacterium fluviatile]